MVFTRTVFCSLTIAIFSPLAAQEWIVPSLCLDRAKEIQIVDHVDPKTIPNYLKKKNPAQGEFNFATIQRAYLETLGELNRRINYPQTDHGELMGYFKACKEDPIECAGYFRVQPKSIFEPQVDNFHVKLFCDRALYSQIFTKETMEANQTLRECQYSKELFFSFPFEDDAKYQAKCVHGKSTPEKATQILNEIGKYAEKFSATVENEFLKKSSFPEGFGYAIFKVQESFGFGGLTAAQVAEASKYAAFAKNILKIQYQQLSDPRYQASAQMMMNVYEQIQQDFARGKFGQNFPMVSEQSEAYLASVFPKGKAALDLSGFNQKKSSGEIWEDLHIQLNQKYDAYVKLFRGHLPYQFIRTSVAKLVMVLQKKKKKDIQWVLDDAKQFVDWADRDVVCPGHESTYCISPSKPGLTAGEKSTAAEFARIRRVFLEKLWNEIKNQLIVLNYLPDASENSERKYIYPSSFLNQLNATMRKVNDFCWSQTLSFQEYQTLVKNPHAYEWRINEFGKLLDEFVKIPRIGFLLKREMFLQKIQFTADLESTDPMDPAFPARVCFTTGKLFGNNSPTRTIPGQSAAGGIAMIGAIPKSYPTSVSDNPSDFPTVNPREKFYPSVVMLTLQDLNGVEDAAYGELDQELAELDQAFYYRDGQTIESYLRKSAFKHIASLMDYAVEHPSQELAKGLVALVTSADQYEKSKLDQIFYAQIGLAVASVALLTIPVFGTSMMLMFTGALTSIATLRFHYWKIEVLEKMQKDVDIAAATFNIDYRQAVKLHGYYRRWIEDEKLALAMEYLLFIPLSILSTAKGIKTFAQVLQEDKILIAAGRNIKYELAIARAGAEQKAILNLPVVKAFLLSPQSDIKVVESILAAAKNGGASAEPFKQLIATHLPDAVADFPKQPVREIPKLPTQSYRPVSTVFKTIGSPVVNFFVKNTFRIMAYFSKASVSKVKFLQRFYFLAKRLHGKRVFAQTIDEFLSQGFITAEEAEEVLADTIFVVKNGKAVPRVLQEVEGLFTEFIQKITNAKAREMIETMFYGDLGSAENWKRLFTKLSVLQESGAINLNEIEEVKNLLKCVKSLEAEYSSLSKYVWNAFITRTIRVRTDHMTDHILLYMKNAARNRNENYVLAYNRIQKIVEEMKNLVAQGKLTSDQAHTYDEIAAWIKDNVDTDFDFAYIKKNIEKIKRLAQEPVEMAEQLADENKWLDEFNRFDRQTSQNFDQILDKEFRLTKDFKKSYMKAVEATEKFQWLERDCYMRYSGVRTGTNKVFKNFSMYASIATGSSMYMWHNLDKYDREKLIDMEFLSRMVFNVFFATMSSRFKVSSTTMTGTGFLNKSAKIWMTGLPWTFADTFSYMTVDKAYWNPETELEAQMAMEMLQSEDVQKRLVDIFQKYPEVKVAINEKADELHKTFHGIMDRQQNGEQVSEEEIYQEFMNKGLIEAFSGEKKDENYEQTIIKALKNMHYQGIYRDEQIDSKFYEAIKPDYSKIEHPYALRTNMGLGDFNSALDRGLVLQFGFNTIDAPMNVVRSHFVTEALCKLRHTKAMSTLNAGLWFAAFKIPTDFIRNYMVARYTQSTGSKAVKH